jgi:hypothetical protein
VEAAVSSGRIVWQLTLLPAQGLFTDNTLDGPEGAITADPSGRYLLIAGSAMKMPTGSIPGRWNSHLG